MLKLRPLGWAVAIMLGTLASPVTITANDVTVGRPGMVRHGSVCFQTTNIYGDARDQWGKEIPCDDRYKDPEEIAGLESLLKELLKRDGNAPRTKADWEAWQASAAAGAMSFDARLKAFSEEKRKQAVPHADASKPFLSGMCLQNREEENDQEVLKQGCEFEKTEFVRNYWFALQGDYDAQMDVARCFRDDVPKATGLAFKWPCHRVVSANEAMQCAWLFVAMSSGHPKSAKAAEQYGYVEECDKKPLYIRQTILGIATDLFQRIYHRPIPFAR